jgi:protein TonB
MAAAAAYNQQREAAGLSPAIPPAADATTTGAGGLVQVPEAAMNAHLIASRVPVIPDDARENGVTGVVRMQATINRNGFVQRLHVLQGPTLLRPAALAAVSAWRYRPYLVNGQPVDVMTTITVDFSSLE